MSPQGDELACLHPADIHVLLVDDEQLSRMVVGNLLRKCDYKVTVVESGVQALDFLRRSSPGTFQLILTDVMMPEVDGLDILRYVRSNMQLTDLPVIMMSANEQKDSVFQAIKGGAEEYLVKPVTKKEVQNIWQYVWKRLSAAQMQRVQSETDLQALQGSTGAAEDDAALSNSSLMLQQQQQPQQHQDFLNSMQQLHRQQQQVAQQLDQQSRVVQRLRAQPTQGNTSGSQVTLLSQYLQRPQRVVKQKEAGWLFCEVLLLLQQAAAGSGGLLQPGMVRPSKLQLHTSGRIAAAAVSATDLQEELVYQSPEETVATGASQQPDLQQASRSVSYSLGVLFVDLLHVSSAGAAGRLKALAGLKQGVLPPGFQQQFPAASALVLRLLQHDPAARPSLQDLLAHKLLSDFKEAVQERYRQQSKDTESLVFFLQTLQGRQKAEVQQVQASVAQLDAQIAEVEAAWRHVQQLQGRYQPQLHQQQQLSGQLGAQQQQQQLPSAVGDAGSGTSRLQAAAGGAAVPADGGRGAAAGWSGSPAAAAGDDEDEDEDDLEMERRELGRHKRQRLTAVEPSAAAFDRNSQVTNSQQLQLLQQQQQAGDNLIRTGSASSGVATSAGATAVVSPQIANKWEHVADKFTLFESLYGRRRSIWEQQQQRHTQEQQQQRHTQEQQQQRHTQEQQQQQQQQWQGSSSPSAAGPLDASAAAAGTQLLPGFLQGFAEDLWAYSRYSSFAVRGVVRAAADVLGGGSAMVCAAAFDRDEEYVATAGVSKRIRIYEYAAITSNANGFAVSGNSSSEDGAGSSSNGLYGIGSGGLAGYPGAGLRVGQQGLGTTAAATGVEGMVYPVLELSSRSRLSCVAWSSYVKAHVASSDYEGVVQLWDANTGSELMQFEEHAKRAWAVDFSRLEPTRLVSSSDDGTVKLWSVHQDSSVATLQLHANVCSVQFSPESPNLLACGCANYRIYLYDLRQTAQPLACVPGHRKAVSYVRWLNGNHLVSASTDNTLKLWNVPRMLPAGTNAAGGGSSRDVGAAVAAACEATYTGHTNERNFIGLAVLPGTPGAGLSSTNSGGSSNSSIPGSYLVCGSETNEVYAYHTSMPVPVTAHDFTAAVSGPSNRRGGALGGYLGSASRLRDLDALSELAEGPGGPGNFVSCVAWNRRQGTVVAANSAGHIRVLELV